MLLSKYCGKTNRNITLFLMDTSLCYLVGNFYSMALVNGEDYTSGAPYLSNSKSMDIQSMAHFSIKPEVIFEVSLCDVSAGHWSCALFIASFHTSPDGSNTA